MKKLYIIGSGGFSKQVIEIIEEMNKVEPTFEFMGLIDDDHYKMEDQVLGYPILGDTDYLKEISEKEEVYAVIAIFKGEVRESIRKNLDQVKWANLIHPKAIVSKYTKLGQGNIICGGTVINPNCSLADHCHINIGSTLGHDVNMDDYVTIMPGANISGNVKIGTYSMVGTGAVILQGLEIEENSTLGAGAVIIKDTKKDSTYVGVPAKKIK